MMEIAIYGTGGCGREVHQIIEDLNAETTRYRFMGWIDDHQAKHHGAVHGFPILGPRGWLRGHPKTAVALGIGSPAIRRRIVEDLRRDGHPMPTLIHPVSSIGNRVDIGDGTIIWPGALISTDITLGAHVILSLGCSVSHDSVLHDFVTAAPSVHLSGNVSVGEGSDLGAGVSIIQGISVGEWAILGAGAVVVRDVPANVTAIGVPAQVIKERPLGWQLTSVDI
jgi:sugar O-acyltransferase (sialic acid O-acetyltransferase NeuD family)